MAAGTRLGVFFELHGLREEEIPAMVAELCGRFNWRVNPAGAPNTTERSAA